MKITLDLPEPTVWALMELNPTESLEEAVEAALDGYIRLERAARRQALAGLDTDERELDTDEVG